VYGLSADVHGRTRHSRSISLPLTEADDGLWGDGNGSATPAAGEETGDLLRGRRVSRSAPGPPPRGIGTIGTDIAGEGTIGLG